MNKLKITVIITFMAVTLVLTSCASNNAPENTAGQDLQDTSPYSKIDGEKARELIKDNENIILVDVRRADEYEAGHIPGAINIPNETISDVKPEELTDLDIAVIVYCRTGVRSKQASDKLVDMGFLNVYDMGGIADWPYETVEGTEPGKMEFDDNEEASQKGLMSEFTAYDINGNAVDDSIFLDYDLTMVNVWATFCGYCIDEMPDLQDISVEYAHKKVRIVGLVTDVVNSDGSLSESQMDTAKKIIEKTGVEYTQIVPSEDLYFLLSQISSIPTTFFIDSEGKQVGTAYLGAKSKAAWVKIIDETLKEVNP